MSEHHFLTLGKIFHLFYFLVSEVRLIIRTLGVMGSLKMIDALSPCEPPSPASPKENHELKSKQYKILPEGSVRQISEGTPDACTFLKKLKKKEVWTGCLPLSPREAVHLNCQTQSATGI